MRPTGEKPRSTGSSLTGPTNSSSRTDLHADERRAISRLQRNFFNEQVDDGMNDDTPAPHPVTQPQPGRQQTLCRSDQPYVTRSGRSLLWSFQRDTKTNSLSLWHWLKRSFFSSLDCRRIVCVDVICIVRCCEHYVGLVAVLQAVSLLLLCMNCRTFFAFLLWGEMYGYDWQWVGVAYYSRLLQWCNKPVLIRRYRMDCFTQQLNKIRNSTDAGSLVVIRLLVRRQQCRTYN